LVTASPTPIEWRAGFGYLVLTSEDKPSYLFGQAWTGGRWWYYPGSLLVKVPAPALVLLIAGPLALRSMPAPLRRRVLTAVMMPAGLLLAFTIAQPLTLGVRLILPVIALHPVAASAAAAPPRRWVRAAVAGVVVLQIVAVVASAPHSIALTTPPFTPAYRWASDANVNYGQDARRLADWSRGRRAGWPSARPEVSLDRLAPVRSSRQILRSSPAGLRSACPISPAPIAMSWRGSAGGARSTPSAAAS
jgi:hypothetical protein